MAYCLKPIWICACRSWFFWKTLLPQNWEIGSKMVQTGIFWIYWKIWSLVFSQFGLWWTLMFLPYSCTDSIIRFLIYVPKCSWTIRLHVFNFNYASRKKWWNEFYYVDTNSRKVKIGYNFFFFGWAWPKKGHSEIGHISRSNW